MKFYLLALCAALVLTGCNKEDVSPTSSVSPVAASKKNAYADDPRGTGFQNGAASANYIAASYSLDGGQPDQNGGGGSIGGNYGYPSETGNTTYNGNGQPTTTYSPGGPGPYGGPGVPVAIVGGSGDPFGIGGGVDYSGGSTRSYNIPSYNLEPYRRDIAALRANAEQRFQEAVAAQDTLEQSYWLGFISGVDNAVLQ